MRTDILALATGVLSDHCFGQSTDFLLDEHGATKWRKTINAIANLTPLAKQFPFINPFALRLPLWPLGIVVPDLVRTVRLLRVIIDPGEKAKEKSLSTVLAFPRHRSWMTEPKQAISSNVRGEWGIAPDEKQTPGDRPNILRIVLASKMLDEPKKLYGRIAQEAFVALVGSRRRDDCSGAYQRDLPRAGQLREGSSPAARGAPDGHAERR